MFCVECGTKLPDGAKFCFLCGKPTSDEVPGNTKETETCEIVYETAGEKWGIYPRTLLRFKAQAIGDKGEYCAGLSPEFEANPFDYPGKPEKSSNKHKKALEVLTEKLQQDGWRMEEQRGSAWYNRRFNRNKTVQHKS